MKLQQYFQEAKAAGVTEFRVAVQSDDGSTVKAIIHPLNASGKTIDVAFSEDASVVEQVSGAWDATPAAEEAPAQEGAEAGEAKAEETASGEGEQAAA